MSGPGAANGEGGALACNRRLRCRRLGLWTCLLSIDDQPLINERLGALNETTASTTSYKQPPAIPGRVKLEDEALDFRVSMTEIERLSEGIAWIDLSFVERDRTPRWAIEEGIRCHLTGMSLREVSKFLEQYGIDRSHVAIHNWVHKADLQPISTVSEDQLAVDEKMIRLHGQQFWLYGAVDPHTNEILHVSLYPTANKQTTRWFLTELHRRYQLDDVKFLVDDADYLGPVLAEDGYRFQIIQHGNRNAIERVFWEIERRTSSFANSFSNVTLETAQDWLEAVAVYHNSRQT